MRPVIDNYCGIISEMKSGDTFFLVQTAENFDGFRQKYLRTSAVVVVSVVAALYAVVAAWCLIMAVLQWARASGFFF